MGTLFIVSTPIGNLKDITFRAIETLQQVDAIACEDTRKTGQLLKLLSDNLGIDFSNRPRFISYFEENEFRRIPEIVTALKNGLSIALVCDAGTPTISDPGFKLVRECVLQGIQVEAIPGASSVLSALTVSGLPTDKFHFIGFLPHKEGNRKRLLLQTSESLKLVKSTVILFEAPHRLLRTLDELQGVFGDIDIVICRELTKLHEEIVRGTISSMINHYSSHSLKGEFVILFHLPEKNETSK